MLTLWAADFHFRGRRYIVGYNGECKRWRIHRERLFTALLWWPVVIAFGPKRAER